jgi:hypothetical protein
MYEDTLNHVINLQKCGMGDETANNSQLLTMTEDIQIGRLQQEID